MAYRKANLINSITHCSIHLGKRPSQLGVDLVDDIVKSVSQKLALELRIQAPYSDDCYVLGSAFMETF